VTDPMGFFSDDFDGIEASDGLEGSDTVPAQFSKLLLEEVTYGNSKNKQTPEFTCRVRWDETHSLSPKRGFFYRFYATPKTQAQIDGVTRAAGLGRTLKRFGDPTGAADTREQFSEGDEADQAGSQLAKALTGRMIIGKVSIEKDTRDVPAGDKYAHKNRIQNFFVTSEENLTAIVAGKYGASSVKIKTRKDESGRKERYLSAADIESTAMTFGSLVPLGRLITVSMAFSKEFRPLTLIILAPSTLYVLVESSAIRIRTSSGP